MKKETVQNSLNGFIAVLSNNIGFDLGKENKKKVFNPFAIENADYIVTLYTLMNLYAAEKQKEIIAPEEVISLKGEKKMKFVFKKDLDVD